MQSASVRSQVWKRENTTFAVRQFFVAFRQGERYRNAAELSKHVWNLKGPERPEH